MENYSIAIINENSDTYLDKLLNSITGNKENVYVIDNCSSDKSAEIAKKHGVINYVNMGKPINNKGVLYNKALDLIKTDLILFVHSDIYFLDDFFINLDKINLAESDFVNFTQYYAEISHFGNNQLSINYETEKFHISTYFSRNPEGYHIIMECSISCFLLRRNMFRFPEQYKNNFYIFELLWKYIINNKKILYTDNCIVIHYFVEEHEDHLTFEYDQSLFLQYNRDLVIYENYANQAITDYFKLLNPFIKEHFNEICNSIIKKNIETFKNAQLFFDTGSDFNEQNSVKKLVNKKSNILEFYLHSNDEITKLRFDPCDSPVIVKINNIETKGIHTKQYPHISWSNAEFFYEDIYYFLNSDPQMVITFDIPDQIDTILIYMEYISLMPNICDIIPLLYKKDLLLKKSELNYIKELEKEKERFSKVLNDNERIKNIEIETIRNEYNMQNARLFEMEDEIKKKNENIEQKSMEIQQQKEKMIMEHEKLLKTLKESERQLEIITNSRIWRISKPIRLIFDYLKRI